MQSKTHAIPGCEVRAYTVGSGGEKRLVIPGINNHPEDWRPLAEELGGMLLVLQNPIHEGLKKREDCAPDWQHWWQHEVDVALQASGCSDVICHSRATLNTLLGKHPVHLQRITMLAPVTAGGLQLQEHPCPSIGKTDDIDLYRLDRTLSTLCPDMELEEIYLPFLQRHLALYGTRYKDILKKENPNNSLIVPAEANRLIHNVRDDIRLIIVGCKLDPWHNQERFEAMLHGRGNIFIEYVQGGHFPHITFARFLALLLKKEDLSGAREKQNPARVASLI